MVIMHLYLLKQQHKKTQNKYQTVEVQLKAVTYTLSLCSETQVEQQQQDKSIVKIIVAFRHNFSGR
jgi:hypothetical protein